MEEEHFSELLTSSFMTLVFSFELIIWPAARSASASLSDHIYTVRQGAHTPAHPHQLEGQRHVSLSHVAARVWRFHTGAVQGLKALLKANEHKYPHILIPTESWKICRLLGRNVS